MDNQTFIFLRQFVSDHIGWGVEEITPDSRLYEDLGIYGDDAYELLIAYGAKFGVDLSNFMAADYFEGEGFDLCGPILRGFTGKRESELKILIIRHLEKGIHAGRLDEEVINYKA